MKNEGLKNVRRYVAVIGLLIFLHYIGILRPVENIFIQVFNPVFSFFYTASSDVRLRVESMSKKTEMIKTESELKAEIRELTEENAKLKMLDKENKELRAYLNFFTKTKYDYKMSSIISREGVTLASDNTKSITINKGLKDGVVDGLAVVSSQGAIIGKVTAASDNFSRVCLISSDNCKFAVMALNETNPRGLIEGDFGLTVEMNLVPQSKTLYEGDIVVTSGLEKDIPDGLVIGRVISVNKNSVELWQTATIEPIVNPDELTLVSVLLPYK